MRGRQVQWKDLQETYGDLDSLGFSGSLNPRSSNNKIAKLPDGSEPDISPRGGAASAWQVFPNVLMAQTADSRSGLFGYPEDARKPVSRRLRAPKLRRACRTQTKTLQACVSWVPCSISDPRRSFMRTTLPFT